MTGLALMVAGLGLVAAEPGAPPVFVLPIVDASDPAAARTLDRALHRAARLRLPGSAGWHAGPPRPGDRSRVVRIVRVPGRIQTYQLRIESPPARAPIAASRVEVPRGTSVALLADVILLKCSILLGLDLASPLPDEPPPRPRPLTLRPKIAPALPPIAVPPRVRPAPALAPPVDPPRVASPRPLRYGLSFGGSGLIGLDRRTLSAGADAAFEADLGRWFRLRIETGWQTSGKPAERDGFFQIFPLAVLAGARWHWRRFEVSALGGLSLLSVFGDRGELGVDARFVNAVTGGLVALGRLAVVLHRRVHLGLGLRLHVLLDRTLVGASGDPPVTATLTLARVLLQPSLDLTFRF